MHAFPEELVTAIEAFWAEHREAELPPLPPPPQLRALVEAAFLASLLTDEGRPIAFTLCCTPPASAHTPSEEERLEFGEPRDFDIQEIRRLAVATHVDSSAIWVEFGPDAASPLRIRGLINLGISWAVARLGFAPRYEPMPHALTLRVDAPGSLTVYHHQAAALTLSRGELSRSARGPGLREGLGPLFEEGVGAITARLAERGCLDAPRAATETRRAYLKVLHTMVQSIRLRKHGGALVICGRASLDGRHEPPRVRPKYTVARGGAYLTEHLLASLTARLRAEAEPNPQQALERRLLTQHLVESTNFIANLSGADGAILLGADLVLLGFGAEIRTEAGACQPVLEVLGRSPGATRPLDAERFGMRHRASIWLSAAVSDVASLVVSQDGDVSLIYSRGGQVHLIPHLDTSELEA